MKSYKIFNILSTLQRNYQTQLNKDNAFELVMHEVSDILEKHNVDCEEDLEKLLKWSIKPEDKTA